MNSSEVKKLVEMHNNRVDGFINNILPKLLEIAGVRVTRNDNGEIEIPMNEWFKAQRFISEMHFYNDAMEILNMVRPLGFDVKITMYGNKLVF